MAKSIQFTYAAMMIFGVACNMGSSDVKPVTETQKVATPEAKSTAAAKVAQPSSTNTTEKASGAATANQAIGGTQNAVVTPSQQTYPIDAIKPVADDCGLTDVLLTTAPKSVGPDYQWQVTRQAMLANQQFKFVSGRIPSEPGEYYIGVWGYGDNAYALVATCGHAPTCNRLAAMYKAIVRSSKPQVLCKTPIQGLSKNQVGTFRWSDEPQANLPQDGDLQAQCARLNACMIATDQSTPGDPYLECQKAPAKFKTDCAKRYPCAEVLACMGK